MMMIEAVRRGRRRITSEIVPRHEANVNANGQITTHPVHDPVHDRWTTTPDLGNTGNFGGQPCEFENIP
jgi:hypothetical protein